MFRTWGLQLYVLGARVEDQASRVQGWNRAHCFGLNVYVFDFWDHTLGFRVYGSMSWVQDLRWMVDHCYIQVNVGGTNTAVMEL